MGKEMTIYQAFGVVNNVMTKALEIIANFENVNGYICPIPQMLAMEDFDGILDYLEYINKRESEKN